MDEKVFGFHRPPPLGTFSSGAALECEHLCSRAPPGERAPRLERVQVKSEQEENSAFSRGSCSPCSGERLGLLSEDLSIRMSTASWLACTARGRRWLL